MSSLLNFLKRPLRSKYLSLKNNSSISTFAKVFRGTEIEKKSRLGPFCDISPKTSIGKWTNLTEKVTTRGNVNIGRFCAIAPEVWIQGHNHDMDLPAVQKRWQKEVLDTENNNSKENVTIGDNVWIGARAIILPGVKISNHSIIGAGSVVTKDVEEFEVVGGSPAKHIRYRFNEEKREKIRSKGWTEMSRKELKNNKDFFRGKMWDNDE